MKDLMHTNCHCERVFEHVSNLFISNDHSVFYTSAWVHMYGCLSICLRGCVVVFLFVCVECVCIAAQGRRQFTCIVCHAMSCCVTLSIKYTSNYFNQCLTITHASPLINCHIFWPSTINYVTLAN